MPDGSITQQQTERVVSETAIGIMHERLIAWGRLVLAGGNGPRQQWLSDGEREFFDYRPWHYDDATAMSGLVLQLPKRQQSLVLASFYVDDRICSVWHELSAHRKQLVSEDIAARVNRALARINRDAGSDLMAILACDVDAIRLRAMRMLCARLA